MIQSLVVLLLLAHEVAAEPWVEPVEAERRARRFVSLPLMLGGTNLNAGGGVFGVRPEVVLARLGPSREDPISPEDQPGRDWGVGGYGEVVDLSGDLVVGAGATLAVYGSPYSVAVSISGYRRWTEEPAESGASRRACSTAP